MSRLHLKIRFETGERSLCKNEEAIRVKKEKYKTLYVDEEISRFVIHAMARDEPRIQKV